MSAARVAFITINSTVSGGKALRALNNLKSTQTELYDCGKNPNMVQEYCKNYDKSKKDEPYYDVLASQIATLIPELFDQYFTNIPIDLVEEGNNLNGFHPQHDNSVVFKMKQTMFDNKEKLTRKDMNELFKYADKTTEHVFIYGPITDIIYTELENKILTCQHNIIIHVQGENILNDKGKDGDCEFGLESKGNLYLNSFNYQNSMKNSQKLRTLIQTNDKCQAFTVACINNPELCVKSVRDEPLKFPLNENGVEIKNGLPIIYGIFYDHICDLINGTFRCNLLYNKLNITTIYQDLVDKDNMTSIVFLHLHNLNLQMMNVHLIGRESYKLQYNKSDVEHYQVMNFNKIKEELKPHKLLNHRNIELNMGKSGDKYWPDFKDTSYELVYDSEYTKAHYLLGCECFITCIADLLDLYKNQHKINYIVNENTLIANPSSDESRIALFNEILFYPYLNTYIMTINKMNPNYFKDSPYSKVVNNATFISDKELYEYTKHQV